MNIQLILDAQRKVAKAQEDLAAANEELQQANLRELQELDTKLQKHSCFHSDLKVLVNKYSL